MTITTGVSSVQQFTQIVVLKNGVEVGVLGDLMPGGTITLDTTAANMRTCTFECLDVNGILNPGSNGTGLLDPTGVEVRIEKGFLVNGVPTLWNQGVFQVTECDVAVGAGGNVDAGPTLTVTGTDRSLRVSLNLFTDSFTTTAGFTAVQAIYQILSAQAPWVQSNIFASDATIVQQTFAPGSDPWQAIVQIAQAAGMVAYFDVNGILVVRPTPAAAGSPTVVAIQDGPGMLANSITAAYSNSPGYNGVIVVGTNPITNLPVSGSAYDMNPNSPTYALGPYGFRPAPPVQNSAVTDSGTAAQMAAALLAQVLGLTITVAMDVLPIPMLDAYSLVYVNNAQSQVVGTFILQQATLSLDYSVLDNITVVPLGTPITDLVYGGTASISALANATPLTAGGGAFAYSPYSYAPYGSTGTGAGFGGLGFGATGLLSLHRLVTGGFVGIPGGNGIWNGGQVWNWLKDSLTSTEEDA